MGRDYEQMELDITLEGDRVLKDNIQEVARFALGQIVQNDHPSPVKNRHEGYGIAAEFYSSLQRADKAVGVEMKSMLSLLPNGDAEFTNLCGSLYNTAIDTAVAAIRLAAQSRRIMEDLYGSDTPTPIEQYAESLEKEDGDGFENVEPTGAEELTEDETEDEENDTAKAEESEDE